MEQVFDGLDQGPHQVLVEELAPRQALTLLWVVEPRTVDEVREKEGVGREV